MIDKELENIITKTSYANPRRYISGNIIEYDIKSANISMLLNRRRITQEYYEYLYRLPKQIREKEIGLAIRKDSTLYDDISNGVKEYKVKLAKANNIQQHEIIRIANDAVYINRPIILQYTQFDNIVFKVSNPINIYLKLFDIIIFATIPLSGDMSLDIKGLGDNYYLHQNSMLQIIGTIIYLIERTGIQDAVNYLSEILDNYINKKLDIEYYREFNAGSMFKVVNSAGAFGLLQSNGLTPDDIDINYNLYILRELWSIILEIYNRLIK